MPDPTRRPAPTGAYEPEPSNAESIIDDIGLRFDHAWRTNPKHPPDIEAFLPDGPLREEVALRLSEIDLARRYEHGLLPDPMADDYLLKFPPLSTNHAAIARLFQAEQAARRNAGKPIDESRYSKAQSTPHKTPASTVNQTLDHTPAPDAPATVPTSGASKRLSADGSPPAGGRYTVLRQHAQGGMGRVCVALDTELNREVAFKEIKPEYADNPAIRRRFVFEAEVTGRLEHPGIVPVYGLGLDPTGRPFYAMRFVEGQSLHDAVQEYHRPRTRSKPGEQAVAFRGLLKRFVDACNAVAFAHSKGYLHRDIKPANIMLGPFGETLVVDWGLARVLKAEGGRKAETETEENANSDSTFNPHDSSLLTQAGKAVGTPAYMPPEQAAGELDRLGPAADVYALGATLYDILTGRPPITGKRLPELLEKAKTGDFPNPRSVNATAPASLEAVCLKAMELEPEDRYVTPLELAADVERWLADEPVSAYREPFRERARRWVKQHRLLVNVVAVVIPTLTVLLAAGLVVVYLEKEKTTEAERLKSAALGREQVAHDQTRQAHSREETAKVSAQTANTRARSALDAVSGDVVTRLLARRPDLGPEEKAFLRALLNQYALISIADHSDPESISLSARAKLRVAQIRQKLGETNTAAVEFRSAIDLYRQLPGIEKRPTDRLDYSTALLGYARTVIVSDDKDALAAIKEGLIVRRDMLAESLGNHERLGAVITALFDAADMTHGSGNIPGAETIYLDVIKLGGPFVLRGELSSDVAEAVGKAFDNLAFIREKQTPPKVDEAERYMTAAIEIFTKLEKDHRGIPEYRNLRLFTTTNRAFLLARTKRGDEAEEVIRRVIPEYRALVQRYPAVRTFRHNLSTGLVNAAAIYGNQRKPVEAVTALEEARQHLIRLREDFPEVEMHHKHLIIVTRELSRVKDKIGEKEEATKLREEADKLEREGPPK